jgi:putative N-acetyltransferase (TIGR04045 family)
MVATETLCLLGGTRLPSFTIAEGDAAGVAAHRALRREVFVAEQSLFAGDDLDDVDDDPRTVVLAAYDREGQFVGGVRVSPAIRGEDIGWWQGSRLTVARSARDARGIGAALVRAACARAEQEGALRFDATVQPGRQRFFARLGWEVVGPTLAAGQPHVLMQWPINRIQALVDSTKSMLGDLLDGLHPGGAGFLGDDGAPVPGSDLVAACDAVVPSLVERDPVWAGWCAVLVNVNDLAAMGAEPVGLLDAVAGRSVDHVRQVLSGLRAASAAYGIPLLGGHTQVGVSAALSVTALGRTPSPVPAAGGRPGHALRLTADLGGRWRPGYAGQQWDSTSSRTSAELAAMVGTVAAARPAAAKDVSMAGLVGTAGMLAEASGCAVELDVAAVPRPAGVTVGDWLTCFPGFAVLTADPPSSALPAGGPAITTACGQLVDGRGVALRWPDGRLTEAVRGPVTGLGAA